MLPIHCVICPPPRLGAPVGVRVAVALATAVPVATAVAVDVGAAVSQPDNDTVFVSRRYRSVSGQSPTGHSGARRQRDAGEGEDASDESGAVPNVLELPTCQKTLQLVPPFVMITDEFVAVTSVLLTLKIKTEAAVPFASRVSPVSCADESKQ